MDNEKADDEDSTTTSEEEDEIGKDWTEDKEKSFLKTLCYLKKKDPKIYDGNVNFFQNDDTKNNVVTKPKKKKEENLFLRDYNRKIMLENDGKFVDEDSDDEDNVYGDGNQSPTYVEEQRLLKDNFKKFLNNENEDDENQTSFAGFLNKKEKTQKEKAEEESDYIEWLKGQKDELTDKNMENELKYLHDYWNNPQLNEGEQFLRDYILQKRYLESESEEESEIGFSEEEETINKQEEFEQSYNFRFEEPDDQFIKTYPRVIESSLRRKEEKRKKKRDLLKAKKEEKLQQKRIELKKKKIEKKKELYEKIEKLKEITGNDTLGFEDADFDGDFNADEYDQKMAQLFNEEFYAVEDDTKPEFSDIDEDVTEYGEDFPNNCDEESTNYDQELNDDNAVENDEEEVSYEDPSFNMDCDYEPGQKSKSKFKQTRSSRKKGHKKSKFMEMVKKEKPVFDPSDKTFQQYLDEYYSLDFEDVVADVPCRFKYRKVTPNDFGLSVEEILAADDKQLNNWCSMKKIDTLRPESVEKFEKKIYGRKGKDISLKRKILPSLFQEDEDNSEVTCEEKKGKKKKKKKRSAVVEQVEEGNAVNCNKKDVKVTKDFVKSKKEDRNNRKRKHSDFMKRNNKQKDRRENGNSEINEKDISDERLKAYGINPKRYKNKIKYGPK